MDARYANNLGLTMDTVTLASAKKITEAINEYGHTNPAADLKSLIAFVKSRTKFKDKEILLVLEFLNGIQTNMVPVTQHNPDHGRLIIKQEDFNLLDEVNFSYGVAKALLTQSTSMARIDSEEVRKNLKSVTSFLDMCVKLQERVLNVEAMQRFQAAVLDAIETVDPDMREQVVQRLLGADI